MDPEAKTIMRTELGRLFDEVKKEITSTLQTYPFKSEIRQAVLDGFMDGYAQGRRDWIKILGWKVI